MLFSYSVIYRAIASEPFFGQFLRTLTERMQGLLPRDAVELLADYIDRTLRDASATVAVFWYPGHSLVGVGSGRRNGQGDQSSLRAARDPTMVEAVGYLLIDDLRVYARGSNFGFRRLWPRGRGLRPKSDRATRRFSGSLGHPPLGAGLFGRHLGSRPPLLPSPER